MNFSIHTKGIKNLKADVLFVFAYSDNKLEQTIFSEGMIEADRSLNGLLTETLKHENYIAKSGVFFEMHTHGKLPVRKVIVVGCGNVNKMDIFRWQIISAYIGKKAKNLKLKNIAVILPREKEINISIDYIYQRFLEALALSTYRFKKYFSSANLKNEISFDNVFLVSKKSNKKLLKQSVDAKIFSQAVLYARDLVNESPSITTPKFLAQVAQKISDKSTNISVDIYDQKDIQNFKMNAFLAVSRGSDEEPRLIKLNYKGGGNKTILLVGKGITFDSGGLSLKSGSGMETMKLDMAGAASILGIFSALQNFRPNVNVIGLIAACENMPSGKAVKPGDVVIAANGKSIEILNTDAEGRLILADAVSYAAKNLKYDEIIDLATLTGACLVALGEDVAGLFSTDVKLASDLKKAADISGEYLWELPLFKIYRKMLDSPVADIKNVAKSKYGGAITGALFIKDFVPDGVSWAHLDIAGPAFSEKNLPLTPYGATGFGVRTILEYIRNK